MIKSGSEERYPLLLLYVEENGKKSEFPQRVVFADKGRAQVTSCWLTTLALGAAFIFISICLLMSSLSPLSFPIHPRCAREISDADYHGNKTIHLVKHGCSWSHKQLDILRFIADTYPDYEIRNIMLDTSIKNFKKREKKKELTTTSTTSTERTNFDFRIPDLTSTFVQRINKILNDEIAPKEDSTENNNISAETNSTAVRRVKRCPVHFFKLPNTYDDIIRMYPNIKERKTTFKEYFQATSMRYFWADFSPEMILFSVRVLELWQNGGISFVLPNHSHFEHERSNETEKHTNITSPSNKTNTVPKISPNNAFINIARLKLLISSTKSRYEKLAEDLVSIDGQGLHMATKIPCHSFFGEMIIKLQRDVSNLTVSNVIQRILNVFCGRGAVDSDYCLKNKK